MWSAEGLTMLEATTIVPALELEDEEPTEHLVHLHSFLDDLKHLYLYKISSATDTVQCMLKTYTQHECISVSFITFKEIILQIVLKV